MGSKMNRTMTRRFYIGNQSIANAIENTGGCPIAGTLAEITEKAKQKLLIHDSIKAVYIVEIVKIVRKQTIPSPLYEIVTEDVI